jgi:mannitol/fructose-specific phosphotransferase system IIA component (Ntr-type)
MNISDMLSDNSFLVNFEATSKKHVLDELTKLAERDIKIDSQILIKHKLCV